MKRIIVFSLVVLLFGICSQAGAWPSYTTNPRYNPAPNPPGGGLEGGENIFLTTFGGSVYGPNSASDSISLTSFKIEYSGNVSNETLGALYQSTSGFPLSLPLSGTANGTFAMEKYWTDPSSENAVVSSVPRVYTGTFTLTNLGIQSGGTYDGLYKWDWAASDFRVSGNLYSIGIVDPAYITLGFSLNEAAQQPFTSQLQPVPLPPSLLLFLPGLIGVVILRRRIRV